MDIMPLKKTLHCFNHGMFEKFSVYLFALDFEDEFEREDIVGTGSAKKE